jgi:hypothetical protein
MEWDQKSIMKEQGVVVQDGCPDTLLANDGPAADGLIVIRLEVAAAAAAQIGDEEKMVMKAVVVVSEIGLAQDVEEMVVVEVWALCEGRCQRYSIDEMVMEGIQPLRKGQCHWQMNMTVQAVFRKIC